MRNKMDKMVNALQNRNSANLTIESIFVIGNRNRKKEPPPPPSHHRTMAATTATIGANRTPHVHYVNAYITHIIAHTLTTLSPILVQSITICQKQWT